MADSKKYNGSTWEHSIRKLCTSTDAITTPPADLYADGNNATVALLGNMSQSGTPTSTTPIQPSECGDRTGNLFDVSTATNEFINSNGSITSATAVDPYYLSDYISADNVTISVQYKETALAEIFTVGVYDSSKRFIRRDVISNNSVSYENVAYIRINYRDINCQNVMLNTGSTPLPYEPYGYVLIISSANTTTPVYLGEVETTRQICKYTFTGQENWTYSASGNKKRVFVTGFDRAQIATSLCSHFVNMDYVSYPDSGKFAINAASTIQTMIFGVTDMAITSATDWTTYLATQYAAGTPVIIWYVLAEPTTGTLNEPIRKIGTYADTVSGITIPTITGKDAFDVQTTLKPSEVSLTYTGWHDATVKEWDGSEWQ